MLYEVLSIISKPSVNSTGVTVQKCSIWVKFGNFLSSMTLKFDRWPSKTVWQLFCAGSSYVHHFAAIGQFKLELQSGNNAQFICKSAIFFPCDLGVWRLTLKNNRAPLLYHFKLCASFRNYQTIQTGVTVRKRPIRVKIGDFWSHVTLKFDEWPWTTIGHLFYATSSFVYYSQPSVNSNSSYSPKTPNLGQNRRLLVPRDLEMWQITLKNNRAPLLCYFKLRVAFHNHR